MASAGATPWHGDVDAENGLVTQAVTEGCQSGGSLLRAALPTRSVATSAPAIAVAERRGSGQRKRQLAVFEVDRHCG